MRGCRIPRGSQIMISPYVTQHDERWFPSPETFDPDWFSPERFRALPNGAYIPFSGGGRVCIGKSFAMMEAQLVLATIVRDWHLDLVPGFPVEAEPVGKLILACLAKSKYDDAFGACTVCFAQFEAGDECVRLLCGHVFHRDCVVQWVNTRTESGRVPTCPQCTCDM